MSGFRSRVFYLSGHWLWPKGRYKSSISLLHQLQLVQTFHTCFFVKYSVCQIFLTQKEVEPCGRVDPLLVHFRLLAISAGFIHGIIEAFSTWVRWRMGMFYPHNLYSIHRLSRRLLSILWCSFILVGLANHWSIEMLPHGSKEPGVWMQCWCHT